MSNFDRDIKIRIGSLTTLKGVDISGLKVDFQISKNLDNKKDNTAKIKIYNLNKATRELLSQKNSIIVFEAGYKEAGNTGMIFKGDVEDVSFNFSNPDNITSVSAIDGLGKKSGVRLTKSYKAGTGAEQVLKDLLSSFGLPERITKKIEAIIKKKTKEFKNGFVTVGSAKEALDKIADRFGFEWSTQDSVIELLEKGGISDGIGSKINVNTGMIGSPVKITQKNTKTKEKRYGWDITTLLDSSYKCGNKVFVESLAISGSYFRIEAINHSGNNETGQFVSKLQVFEYGS